MWCHSKLSKTTLATIKMAVFANNHLATRFIVFGIAHEAFDFHCIYYSTSHSFKSIYHSIVRNHRLYIIHLSKPSCLLNNNLLHKINLFNQLVFDIVGNDRVQIDRLLNPRVCQTAPHSFIVCWTKFVFEWVAPFGLASLYSSTILRVLVI